MQRLVDRHGATAVAAVASLVFLVPLAAWAGAVDLYPSPGVWATGAFGVVMVVPWVVFARAAFAQQRAAAPRAHRFEWRQMSAAERRWAAVSAAGAIGVIGWLNAAATVDLGLLGSGVSAGRPGVYALICGALAVLVALVAIAFYGWRRNRAAAAVRMAQDRPR